MVVDSVSELQESLVGVDKCGRLVLYKSATLRTQKCRVSGLIMEFKDVAIDSKRGALTQIGNEPLKADFGESQSLASDQSESTRQTAKWSAADSDMGKAKVSVEVDWNLRKSDTGVIKARGG